MRLFTKSLDDTSFSTFIWTLTISLNPRNVFTFDDQKFLIFQIYSIYDLALLREESELAQTAFVWMEVEDLFKPLYKKHRRARTESLDGVFDPRKDSSCEKLGSYELMRSGNTWSCSALPGLRILPGYLSSYSQTQLTRESLSDFLRSPENLTNLDAHYDLDRPLNLFRSTSSSESSCENERSAFLVRDKLRWVTLGGQYNWTTKRYPSFKIGSPGCPAFPDSLTKTICSEFGIEAQAAIVNYYKEGDILSPHQDVAELCQQDLLSISLGCDCIFYICRERYNSAPLAILLRSGDVIVMGGESRTAFHGVGRIFSASSPKYLCDVKEFRDSEFHNWMLDHRININVRQMRDN